MGNTNAIPKPEMSAFEGSVSPSSVKSPASLKKRVLQSPIMSPGKKIAKKVRRRANNAKSGRLEAPTPLPDMPLEKQWFHIYSPTKTPIPSKFKFSDFEIGQRCLGQGAFAKVMLATHKGTGQRVAVKVISKAHIPEGMNDYVVGEAHVLMKLKYKSIVKLLLTHEDDEHIYMFLQFMAGGDLHSRVERDGRFTEPIARHVFANIIDAVDYCHRNNYCHRDLKLENVLISGEGLDSQTLLIDFGFAGYMPSADYKFTDFPGSVCYAAPELIKGKPYHGRSADIYSLGVVLYTMMFGRYPFYSEDKREMFKLITESKPEFDASVSQDAKALLTWMLMKEPSLRPTMQEIKAHRFFTPAAPKSDKFAQAAVDAMPMLSPLKSKVTQIKDEVERLSDSLGRLSMSPTRTRRAK